MYSPLAHSAERGVVDRSLLAVRGALRLVVPRRRRRRAPRGSVAGRRAASDARAGRARPAVQVGSRVGRAPRPDRRDRHAGRRHNHADGAVEVARGNASSPSTTIAGTLGGWRPSCTSRWRRRCCSRPSSRTTSNNCASTKESSSAAITVPLRHSCSSTPCTPMRTPKSTSSGHAASGAAIICGHDYCDKFPGVIQIVNELGGPQRLQGTLWVL